MKHSNLLEFASFSPEYMSAPSSWVGHFPFAAWVIQQLSPNIFVELGTHTGNSYFSFCQGVAEAGTATQCYAVDTWQGDEHSGRYSDDIFQKVEAHHRQRYAAFSHLLRMTFDDAVSNFLDSSIGLLHIDGLHTYDAALHDFTTWLPKLAPGAVVLLHDTNVREGNFGVWRLWEELQGKFPCNLEFKHSHGLGVLQVNNAEDHSKLEWLRPGSREKQKVISYFSALGTRQLERFNLLELGERSDSLNKALDDCKEQIKNLTRTVAERAGQLAVLRNCQQEQEERMSKTVEELRSNTLLKIGQSLGNLSYRKWRGYHRLQREILSQPLFDAEWYLKEYPDVKISKYSPLCHYYYLGAKEGRNPSPYFDTKWYLKEYKDVAHSGINPLLHYVMYCVRERRSPNPYFDTDWYLNEYPDVTHSAINPLLHYLQIGFKEGKNPNPYFDTRWYLREYLQDDRGAINPLLHFMKYGLIENTQPGPCFDTRWYLSEYPDVAGSGLNPLLHFMKYGLAEMRDPNPYFDTRWYLSQYQDVARSCMNPLAHYLKYGVTEGKNPSPYFDTRWYLAEYPDIAHYGINPLAHYVEKGIDEERNPSPHFNARWYLLQYSDVSSSGMNPLLHFIKYGGEEGRNPSPYFDTKWYLREYPDVVMSGLNPLVHFVQHGIPEGRNPSSHLDVTCYLNSYCKWIWQFDTLNDDDRRIIKKHIQDLPNPPLLSVLMPVFNPPPQYLDEAIWSVRKQRYPHWELCIADDASTDQEVKKVIQRHIAADIRIKVIYRENNGHISHASNTALSLATGDFIALLDHDDLLPEHALFWVAEAIERQPTVGLIYSDEDKIDMEGNRIDPYFKCDWNPFLFLGHNLVCHLGVYRTSLVRELEGFRAGYEGAQDYDLAARIAEKLSLDQIIHIPRILYHWRVIPGSTASATTEKPYALIASEKVINEHLSRINLPGKALGVSELGGMHRVVFCLPENPPLVSILIPTRNGENLVRQCIESIIAKTTYLNFEIVLIDNGSDSPTALEYFSELAKNAKVRIIRDDSPFNFPHLNNRAAEEAQGEILVLLNNDTEVVSPEWLSEMVSLALLPNIGAVGARLCYPDGTLQHGGVIMGLGGAAGHAHSCIAHESAGYFGRAKLLQMVTAVTGACLAIKKSVYQEVGGLDEEKLQIGYNDVDFCLKLRKSGFWNVWTPHAELIHYESVSRGYEDTAEKRTRFFNEMSILKKRWPNSFFNDPAYNPNLTFDGSDFALGKRPRIALSTVHQPKLFSQSFIPAPTKTIRLLIVTNDRQAAKTKRFCAIADMLCKQGIIAMYAVADKRGFVYTSSASDGWFDAICLLGDPIGLRWFQQSVVRRLPYLTVWNDVSDCQAFAHNKDIEDIRQSFVHSASISVHSKRIIKRLENLTGYELEFCTNIIPDGLDFPDTVVKNEKPKGVIWQSDDLIFSKDPRDAIIRAVNEISTKYSLPVYLIGRFPNEIYRKIDRLIVKEFTEISKIYDFLRSSGALIGITPIDQNGTLDGFDSITWRSDVRMVEYGGFGIPAVYSAIPPYLDTDLRTGRVVRNTYEEWRGALEDIYLEDYQTAEVNSQHIRELRSLEKLAGDLWGPAIRKALLDQPVPASVIMG